MRVTATSPEARAAFVRIACERNTPERVEAFLAKLEAGLKPTETRLNPGWEKAFYEIDIAWHGGKSPQSLPKDPYPFRYNDIEAGERHMRTARQQPECIPIFLTVWSDGSTTEALWDEPRW